MLMTDPQRAPISGARRVARIAVAAGLVAALSSAGPIPMAFSADHAPATPGPGTKSASAKLGSDDADLLAEAKADAAIARSTVRCTGGARSRGRPHRSGAHARGAARLGGRRRPGRPRPGGPAQPTRSL